MIRLGLTGSIGMGKTTTAAMFAEAGAPVFDADAAVHQLYAPGAAAAAPIEAAFPGVTVDGGVDRQRLSAKVVGDPDALARLEAIVHPLVAAVRTRFLDDAEARGVAVVVLDIPLLFESGRRPDVDAVVVASAPEAEQRRRVLARPGATAERFEALLARQMPDAEKRRRADFVVDTGQGLEAARRQVRLILSAVADPRWRPKARLEGPGEASQ